METLTMYRYSMTGDFGYVCYRDNEEVVHISGAPLPNDPVHIYGCGINLKSEKESALAPLWMHDTEPEMGQNTSNERLVTNEQGETIAVLHCDANHSYLTFKEYVVTIECSYPQYTFVVGKEKLATITKATRNDVPPFLKQNSSCDWVPAFELCVIETVPAILLALIAAFPMLKF